MIEVVSTYQLTAIVPANSGGPYSVDAAAPVTLNAVHTHPDATYFWELGDGATATTPSVDHTYEDDGIYVAKLTVTVNQPGGATSEHFAEIHVKNVPPTVDAGPDRTFNEGDVVTFAGTFIDPEWADTHEATWDWGDYQLPTAGVVTESNTPPASPGAVAGVHAWGDNGTYTVKLTVRDDDGGVGDATAVMTVLNVPPVVDAGQPMYAYPCTVITLTGNFQDMGWLDTHVANWSFGDCTPPHTAVVYEQHDPPKGVGTAVASHVYRQCGVFEAICTVIDDDGGVGSDATVVRVVEVENAGFENGFRRRLGGAVANGWEPYRHETERPGDVFTAEELLVHGGQRSQCVHVRSGRAGIRQQLGTNPGWDYQIAAWYSLDENANGTARLGIDPDGGTDPDAPGVVWDSGSERLEWAQLVARVQATASAITIFLEADADADEAIACFDDVELVPIQPFCPDEPPKPKPQTVCVAFSKVDPGATLPPAYALDGFTFRSRDKAPQHVAGYGDPVGQGKLQLRVTGVDIDLPFAADRVTVDLWERSGKLLKVCGSDGSSIVDSKPVTGSGTVQLDGVGIVEVSVVGGDGEALLIRVCARRQTTDSEQFGEGRSPSATEPALGPGTVRADPHAFGPARPMETER